MLNLLKNLVSPHHILVKSCDNIIYDVISDINYDHTINSVTNSLVQFVFYSLVICVFGLNSLVKNSERAELVTNI